MGAYVARGKWIRGKLRPISIKECSLVDNDIRDKIGLEFVQIDVETTVKSQRSRDAGNHLCNKSVEICERRRADVEVLFADIVDSFIVDLKAALIFMLNELFRLITAP
jgi:hypothetical protein